MIEYRYPSRAHIHELIQNMREHDRAETLAARGGVPMVYQDLLDSVRDSAGSAQVALDAGRVICIFGCNPHPTDPDTGVPWMLATDLVYPHALALTKKGRRQVLEWHRSFKHLSNFADQRNKHVLTWLRWMGFHFVGTLPVGATTFIHFSRSSSCANP